MEVKSKSLAEARAQGRLGRDVLGVQGLLHGFPGQSQCPGSHAAGAMGCAHKGGQSGAKVGETAREVSTTAPTQNVDPQVYEGGSEVGSQRSSGGDRQLEVGAPCQIRTNSRGVKDTDVEHLGKALGSQRRADGGDERRVRMRVSDDADESKGARASRPSGGKDRHSKVNTAKGPRDRRVRLSVSTAVQFYDVQDRLGFDQPSKAVEWLIKKAQSAIDELAHLPVHRVDTPDIQAGIHVSNFSVTSPAAVSTSVISSRRGSFGTLGIYTQPKLALSKNVQSIEVGGGQGQTLATSGPLAEVGITMSGSEGARGRDMAGCLSARVESRAKARERARERAKEKISGREGGKGMGNLSLALRQQSCSYTNLPLEVGSSLQHPFQAPFPAGNPHLRMGSPSRALSNVSADSLDLSSFSGSCLPSSLFAPHGPLSPLSLSQSLSVSQLSALCLTSNSLGAHHQTANTATPPGFSPRQPASALRPNPPPHLRQESRPPFRGPSISNQGLFSTYASASPAGPFLVSPLLLGSPFSISHGAVHPTATSLSIVGSASYDHHQGLQMTSPGRNSTLFQSSGSHIPARIQGCLDELDEDLKPSD